MSDCQGSVSIHAVDELGSIGLERRARGERRRNGLYELRARRNGAGGDRRRPASSAESARRRLQALWRRLRSTHPHR